MLADSLNRTLTLNRPLGHHFSILLLDRPPHQNTLSAWMNDPDVTPILRDWLRRTATPFRRCEVGGIIDASKFSQMRTAHPRYVEYNGDRREGADWTDGTLPAVRFGLGTPDRGSTGVCHYYGIRVERPI